MQSLVKNIQYALFMFLTAIFVSCNEDANIPIYEYPPATFTSATPASGYPGTYVEIRGTNFGNWPGAVKVWFGGVQAAAIITDNLSDSLIRVQVPSTAVSGKVTVQVWTSKQDSLITYEVVPAPVVTSVVSEGLSGKNSAVGGDIVSLTGKGFGSDASKIQVTFNGKEATIIEPITDTFLKVVAPEHFNTGPVYLIKGGLSVAGNVITNPDMKNISAVYLKNYKQPFTSTAESGTGRWRIPTDWIVTDPVKNHGGFGGWGSDNGTVLALESGWGSADIVGGSMYQTITLPAGHYNFKVQLGPNAFDNNSVYLVAAAGSSIPTVTPTTANTLGFSELHAGTLDFTLTEETQVSLGLDVASMTGNKYLRITSFTLSSK